ncbi:MAG: methyltransferase [Patescibacteria group bacterium]
MAETIDAVNNMAKEEAGPKVEAYANTDKTYSVHHVLAHSYSFYFVAFLLGLFFDFIFPLQLFSEFDVSIIGVALLVIGTFLVIWAQKSSSHLNRENMSKESFCNGPYRYTRSPTNYGIFLSLVGFGLIMNASFIIIFSAVSLLVTKFVFIKKQEEILAYKYGTPYLEYKSSVKF